MVGYGEIHFFTLTPPFVGEELTGPNGSLRVHSDGKVKGDLGGFTVNLSLRNSLFNFGYRAGSLEGRFSASGRILDPLNGGAVDLLQNVTSFQDYSEAKWKIGFLASRYFNLGLSYQLAENDFSAESAITLSTSTGSTTASTRGHANFVTHYVGPEVTFMWPMEDPFRTGYKQYRITPRLIFGPKYQITPAYMFVTAIPSQINAQRKDIGSHSNWGYDLDVGTTVEWTHEMRKLKMWSILGECGYRVQEEFGGGSLQEGIYLRFGLRRIW